MTGLAEHAAEHHHSTPCRLGTHNNEHADPLGVLLDVLQAATHALDGPSTPTCHVHRGDRGLERDVGGRTSRIRAVRHDAAARALVAPGDDVPGTDRLPDGSVGRRQSAWLARIVT